MFSLLTSKRLQNVVFIGFVAVSARSVDAGKIGTASCDAPSPVGVVQQGNLPREFSDFPMPFQPESNGSAPNLAPEPSSPSPFNGPSSGGGFGDLNLISGSRGGDSFAALAPGTYIDNAVISNMFRFRVDAGYNNFLADRAEFFYGQCGCFGGNAPGPGSPGNPGIANRDVDFQEFVPYFERALSGNFSIFAETPFRLINPDATENTGGLSDINAGIKASLLSFNHQYLTGQFRVYAPTGDADRGLGNGHATLEPGLLYLGRKSDRLILQSEFRVWIPLSDSRTTDGRNFAGTILRYGIGGGYDLLNLDTGCQRRRLTGTLETVGWSITSGQAFDASTGNVLDATGDTIVNIKSGLRYTFGRRSIAASYGKPITGDRWYSDILRVEYRYAY